MAWVRLDDEVAQHPKILRAGPAAAWLWVCGLAYCSRHLTDGHVPREALVTFGVPGANRLAVTLVQVGLWERSGEGFAVHDYHQYQPSRRQVSAKRKAAAARLHAWRVKNGLVGSGDETPQQEANERECNAVTDSVANDVYNATPVPVPVPIPIEEPKGCDAREVAAAHPRPAKPLSYRPRVDVAWPGRPPVPGGLHAEFIDKLGGADADARLRAWYPVAAAAFEGQPIGDDDWRFWRLRFREWVGTTATDVRSAAAPMPTYGDTEWCQHEPRCGSRNWHDVLVAREAETVEQLS
jgi:hypothetical protein